MSITSYLGYDPETGQRYAVAQSDAPECYVRLPLCAHLDAAAVLAECIRRLREGIAAGDDVGAPQAAERGQA